MKEVDCRRRFRHAKQVQWEVGLFSRKVTSGGKRGKEAVETIGILGLSRNLYRSLGTPLTPGSMGLKGGRNRITTVNGNQNRERLQGFARNAGPAFSS